jgi:CRISPR/Cas system-associated exonuclease Cas4 (RecB family)
MEQTEEKNHYSYSGLSMYDSCPRSYEFKYIKMESAAFQSIEAHLGSSIHEAIAAAYQKKSFAEPIELKDCLELFHQYWHTENLSQAKIIKKNTSIADYFDQGITLMTHFFQQVFCHDRSESLYLEHTFYLNLNSELLYKGVIDRVCRTPQGKLCIIDFKSGKAPKPLENLQLPSYGLYIFENNPDQEIELKIENLKDKQTHPAKFNRQDCQAIRQKLITKIQSILKQNQFLPNPSMLCHWCGFNAICSEGCRFIFGEVITHSHSNHTASDYQTACPDCGSELKQRKGKFGDFLGCSNYPQCRFTLNLSNRQTIGQNSSISSLPQEIICPLCGKELKQRNGKFGPFFGCSGYPDCRFSRPQ